MSKDYVWCLHCERAYKLGSKECPYCGADPFMDGWDWKIVRENNPEYPEIPEKDVVYPMYQK